MFAGTEKREFCCVRCKRKEEKRKYYWAEVLGIPTTYWPATRVDQDGNIIKSEDDSSPQPERGPPLLGLTEALILRQALAFTKAQQPLGLLEEDKEATALQEKTSFASKTKRRKRKKKNKHENPTKRSTQWEPRLRKDLVAQDGGLYEGEFDSSSLGSDLYSSEEDEVRKNFPWWEATSNCERCVYHHQTHKKWKSQKSPKSENMRMHTQRVMRELLAKKDSLDNPSLELFLKKWWGGNLTCKQCKEHHEADEYNTCLRSHNEGVYGIDPQKESLPTYDPNNRTGPGGNPWVNTLLAGENLTNNPTNINDITSRSHVLSPTEQLANKWKEKNLSLRWWEPETDCKKCTSHHRAFRHPKRGDNALEPPPSKGIHDLTNLEDPGNIYLRHGHGSLDSSLLENDERIKAGLKPIKTSRKVEVKSTLPCLLHSHKILEESKWKALSRATAKQINSDFPKWWEQDPNCERCSQHHKADQKPRTKVMSPENMANGRWKNEIFVMPEKDKREDCKKCLYHHEASGKLAVSKGVVEWKKKHEEEPLLHARQKKDSKKSNMKRDNFKKSELRPKKNVNHLPLEFTVVREVEQDTLPSSGTTSSTTAEKHFLSVIREVEQDDLILSSTTTPGTKENPATRSMPQELQSKLDSFGRNYLNPNEEVVRRVAERREEMYNAHKKGYPFSRSFPNLNCEVGVQTLPVQICEKPKPFTESERDFIEHRIGHKSKNPWIELQAPTPREELRRLRAKEHDLNKRRSLVEQKLKRAERIRQLSKEADEREAREAFSRAPRVAPTGYKWRESLRNDQESTSDSSKTSTKPLHSKEFSVLGKGRDKPITPPYVKDSNSSSGTPGRTFLRRKLEMSQIKPKSPSLRVEKRKHKSDQHRHKPKLNNQKQGENTQKLSPMPKTTQVDLHKVRTNLPKAEGDHASIQLNGDDPNPKLEGNPPLTLHAPVPSSTSIPKPTYSKDGADQAGFAPVPVEVPIPTPVPVHDSTSSQGGVDQAGFAPVETPTSRDVPAPVRHLEPTYPKEGADQTGSVPVSMHVLVPEPRYSKDGADQAQISRGVFVPETTFSNVSVPVPDHDLPSSSSSNFVATDSSDGAHQATITPTSRDGAHQATIIPTSGDGGNNTREHTPQANKAASGIPITNCMTCLRNHKNCGKTKKQPVHIPRLDLQKVKDIQKLEEEEEEEEKAKAAKIPHSSVTWCSNPFVGCFGPMRRNGKRRWIDPDKEMASGSKSSSSLDSGGRREEHNKHGIASREFAFRLLPRHTRAQDNRSTKDLLEKAKRKLSDFSRSIDGARRRSYG